MVTPKYYDMLGLCPICGNQLPDINPYVDQKDGLKDDVEFTLMDDKTIFFGRDGVDAEIQWGLLPFAEYCVKCNRTICPDCYTWSWDDGAGVKCKECFDGNIFEEEG